MQSITTTNHLTYNPVVEYIVPKSSFEEKLTTRSGLKEQIALLQTSYDKGIASNWQDSIKTDICLLPKIVWQIHKKYPTINLIILELGFSQLDFELTKLMNNNITSAKLVISSNNLELDSNHFIVADYSLDTSSAINKASVIFLNAGAQDYNMKYWITKLQKKIALENKYQIKFFYISLDIQKSNVDCLIFSLELAKAAHKSTAEMQQLHLLNINAKLNGEFTPEEERAIISTGKPFYKFDRYIPFNMMKHCQSSKRVSSYITLRKICGNNTTIALNKKQESLEARCKQFTRDKTFVYRTSKITTSFSVEYQRLSLLKKIEQNWEDITDVKNI